MLCEDLPIGGRRKALVKGRDTEKLLEAREMAINQMPRQAGEDGPRYEA